MRNSITFALLGTAATLLAGCGSGGGILSRERPDEMAVQRQAPLVVPPDFSLVPPSPGAPRPSDESPSDQALEALFGAPPRSPVEISAINRAGASAPGIRSSIGDPATNTVAKGRVTRDIIAAPEGDGPNSQAIIPG